MKGKQIKHGEEVQKTIIAGVDKVANAVKTTLGPSGKCVAISTEYGTDITRDGVTVAKSINLTCPIENTGAELVRKAALSTEEQTGDSTTTTTVLIQELCHRGQKAIGNGANVSEMKAGMLKARDWMSGFIKENAISINGDLDKIHKVATISANNDSEIGDLVVKAIQEVGFDGLITADMRSGLDNSLEITKGCKINTGWSSPQYVTEAVEGTCTLENPYIVVAGENISSMNQCISLLEDYSKNGQNRPLLIFCDEIADNVNATFVFNVLRGALRACIVKGVDFGDGRKNVMADIAAVVGANYLCKEKGTSINAASMADLGQAAKVVISRDNTIIYEGCGDQEYIKERADVIKAKLDDPSTTDYDKHKFASRLSMLIGAVAIIKAGGASEVERTNKRATIEDSILAAHSAIEEGYACGGGSIYLRGADKAKQDKAFWKGLASESEREGAKIVFDSLPCILKTVASNSGIDGEVVLEKVRGLKGTQGYNAKTKKYGDLIEEGVLDSAKALRVSLENAISAAGMILMTDCVIFEEPGKEGEGVV